MALISLTVRDGRAQPARAVTAKNAEVKVADPRSRVNEQSFFQGPVARKKKPLRSSSLFQPRGLAGEWQLARMIHQFAGWVE